MRFIFEERPSDSPLVALVWRTQSEEAGTFVSRAVSNWELVVWRHAGASHMAVRGPETGATIADCPADAEFLGIQFRLGAFMPHLPFARLVDRAVVLPEAGGDTFWLQSATWQFPTFENADTFVDRLARADLLACDPVVVSVLDGVLPVVSPRTIQYRFQRATGLTQSVIYQIERARRAATLLEQGAAIADVVDTAGYSDQPHLTRSLRRFIGQTPGQLARGARPA